MARFQGLGDSTHCVAQQVPAKVELLQSWHSPKNPGYDSADASGLGTLDCVEQDFSIATTVFEECSNATDAAQHVSTTTQRAERGNHMPTTVLQRTGVPAQETSQDKGFRSNEFGFERQPGGCFLGICTTCEESTYMIM